VGGVGLTLAKGFEGGRPPAVALRFLPRPEAELMLQARPTDAMRARWHPEYPLADTLEGLTWLFAAWQEMGGLDETSPWWTYQLVVDGQAVGDIGFHGPPDDQGQLTIGYQVVPAAQGRGIATAACGQLAALAWSAGADRLLAHTDGDNLASQRVLRRNGFLSADGRSFALDRP
jgi:RimJ/RimL family protein N-acetyltransferase